VSTMRGSLRVEEFRACFDEDVWCGFLPLDIGNEWC
jgi:hypothetical protein